MQGETSATSTQATITSPISAHPHHHTGALFHHEPHPHKPHNVNHLHEVERAAEGFNTKIAIALTNSVGTMWTAYLFVVIAIVGLLAILQVFSPLVALLVAWASQTLIQLVLLPVIMVGQNVLNRKSELQAEEQFNTTINIYHDMEQVMQHLVAQDAELLRHARMLEQLLVKNGVTLQQIETEIGHNSHLEAYKAQPVAVPSASPESAQPNPAQ